MLLTADMLRQIVKDNPASLWRIATLFLSGKAGKPVARGAMPDWSETLGRRCQVLERPAGLVTA